MLVRTGYAIHLSDAKTEAELSKLEFLRKQRVDTVSAKYEGEAKVSDLILSIPAYEAFSW